MNELSRHIEILLLENDCVIIPGFGGFMAHHVSAVYVEEEGTFYPPQRTLGFNPHLQLNDSLLVQSYVEAYDISYPEAVRKIEAEVEEIRQCIAIDGAYEFHGIGVIKVTADEKYDFEPCAAGLLTPNLYALNSYSMDVLSQKPALMEMPLKPLEKEVETDAVEDTAEEEVLGESLDDNFVHISYSALRNVMAAAMLLLLFVFSSIPVGQGSDTIDHKSTPQLQQCSVVDTELFTSFITPAPTPVVMDSVKTVKPEVKEETVEQEEKKQEESALAEASRFAIVLASKVSKQGAEDYISRLASQGLKKASVHERGNMRKVIYGSYKSKEEAAKELSKMREENVNFTDAWVSEI